MKQSPHLDEEIRSDELADISVPRGPRIDGSGMFSESPHRPVPKAVKWGAAALAAFFVVAFGVSYYIARHAIANAVGKKVDMLQAGVQDLKNFDFTGAEQKFTAANGEPTTFSGILGMISSVFSGGVNAVGSFGDLSGRLELLTQDLSNTEGDMWSAFSPGASSTLVADLQGVRSELGAIDTDAGNITGLASSFGGDTASLGLITQLRDSEKFLDAFIPWLSDATTTHHVLVILENPSEMRPGGGFIGSYADVAVRAGAVQSIGVHDIADADTAFRSKIVPPVPLQLEETGWRPADGNWFFDFPTTASETISLFESAAPSTTYDAAIAVTPQAIGDILSVTGPVSVGSTTFSSDDLTQKIQDAVQAGQAKGSAQAKSVIGEVWTAALGQLASSTDTQKQDLLSLAAGWIGNKDVMAYFKDPAIENFIQAYGAGGNEYAFPQDFNGDYLAVANTDVNSDKSELYVSSTVALTVQLGADGTATDHLVITRVHHGNMAPKSEWWYRTTNQDWLQVFVPEGSTLVNESGGFAKKIAPPINYARNGYSTDPLVATMQSSTAPVFAYPAVSARTPALGDPDAGRTVWSVWDRTYAASSTQIIFDYTHPLYAKPADGTAYQFVIERQSGDASRYKAEIDAPLGYVFAENGLASWTYDSVSSDTAASDGMPGQFVVTLTLQKI